MKYVGHLILGLIVAGSLYYLYTNSSLGSSPNEQVRITGKVLTGGEIGIDYCADALYLIPDNLVYPTMQLRSDIQTIIRDQSLAGSVGTVIGSYDAEKFRCKALACECDDYMIMKDFEQK